MIHPARASRLTAIEDDLLDILDYTPTIVEDPDVLDMLNAFEEELIRNGDL